MNLNYQKARNLMVENQLRPNKIKDPSILEIFNTIPKEIFLNEENRAATYSDLDIHLCENRGYLKTLHIAQLITSSNIEKKHKILHIGGLTGYVSVLLANLCKEVFVIEPDNQLKSLLEKNIKDQKIDNIKIVKGELDKGCVKESPYDLIFIDSPIGQLKDIIKQQLSSELGKIIMIQKISNHLNHAYKIIKNHDIYTKEYLFDVFTKYKLYEEKKGFIF
ncbi:methyltransferase [Alphaproteobacteria bacterium]|nr:methyltransferase [Alphaproteobacteria bacterium]